MVQTIFYLRFTAQLSRTRPELIHHIESDISRAVENAGGTISRSRQCIKAVYNEHSVGFWLDILMLIETVQTIMERESPELYGYALLIGGDLANRPESLCHDLALGPRNGGVFLDQAARDSLMPYIVCEQIQKWPASGQPDTRENQSDENLVRIKELKTLAPESTQNLPLAETVVTALEQGPECNTLIMGPAFCGKRQGVHRYCRDILDDFPPLTIRFGSGGLNALTDSWHGPIQELAQKASRQDIVPEINSLWKYLFQQRLRKEVSAFTIQNGHRFFSLLLELYSDIATEHGVTPIVVLENINRAEKTAARILIDTVKAISDKSELTILGTCGADTDLKNWEDIFPHVVKLQGETVPPLGRMPPDLQEIAYSLYLFSRYFPSYMFPQFMRTEGKNPAMLVRALSILHSMGVIDSVDDPHLRIKNFLSKSTVPEEKKELIRAMVRRHLLLSIKQGTLNPCFNLLTILSDLDRGECPNDELILKSIYADTVNGTVQEIEKAINDGSLEKTTGTERAQAIVHVYSTMQALLTGAENDIRSAFANAAPDCSAFPILKAQALANMSAYQLGIRNVKPALEVIKESILFSQGKNNFCLAQSYRLFSLVSLSRQQVGETGEYLNFAMENAEKSDNSRELGLSAYYAAASQFLFGNISKAIRLARKAIEQTLAAGLHDWADKARFLEGRLAFEIGSYREALHIFDDLLKKPSGRSSAEKTGLLAAWAYRAQIYIGNPLIIKPENLVPDADLFEVEAAYLSGDYRKTVELVNGLLPSSTNENFLFTEQPDWRSGFAQCELLLFSREEIWKRMIGAYHSLALCRTSTAAGEEAKNNIQRILRDEQLSEMDPWEAFYFFAWYRILEYTGAEQIDKNTAISLAFKRIQRRASRIDDIETRRQFLSQSRWNGELSLAAKEFRLI